MWTSFTRVSPRAARPAPRRSRIFLFFCFTAWLPLGLSCGSDPSGSLTDSAGTAIPDTVVRLISIDDAGLETSALDTTTTDETGSFQFATPSNTNGGTLVEATPSGGTTLRAFWAGSQEGVPLNSVTTEIVSLVVQMTETTGGRSLSDFSPTEIREFTSAAFSDATFSDLDRSSSSDIRSFLRSQVGRLIALASGGSIEGQTTTALEADLTSSTASFSTDPDLCSGANHVLFGGHSFQFPIEADGTLCRETSTLLNPILDSASLQLTLLDDSFFFFGGNGEFPTDIGNAALENDRELRLGPHSLRKRDVSPEEEDSLQITRKIYAETDSDQLRFLEIFENSGSSVREISPRVDAFLLTGNDSMLLTFDGSNETPDLESRFIVAYDHIGNRPSVGLAFQDGFGSQLIDELANPSVASLTPGNLRFSWNALEVPANSKVTLLHYLVLDAARSADLWQSTMKNLVLQPDMTGMSLEELAGLANFAPTLGTIWGEAGAVIGEAVVTAENGRSGKVIEQTARSDGSFAIPMNTESGDTITLTASDGLDSTLEIP